MADRERIEPSTARSAQHVNGAERWTVIGRDTEGQSYELLVHASRLVLADRRFTSLDNWPKATSRGVKAGLVQFGLTAEDEQVMAICRKIMTPDQIFDIAFNVGSKGGLSEIQHNDAAVWQPVKPADLRNYRIFTGNPVTETRHARPNRG